MGKIRFTKGELKRQRDALRQYQRYLPTLQLKKQQLQMEILRHLALLMQKQQAESAKRNSCLAWAGLLATEEIEIRKFIQLKEVIISEKNIAGVSLPVFEQADFYPAGYDLFTTPLWVDAAIESLKIMRSLREEIALIQKGLKVLRQELRITTQRVNLFEKVKIPDAEEAIQLIKIYIGDQMANAVGRSKIAKRKIEAEVFAGAAV